MKLFSFNQPQQEGLIDISNHNLKFQVNVEFCGSKTVLFSIDIHFPIPESL